MTTAPAGIRGPHQAIPARSPQERFLAQLLDALWDRYRERVEFVRQYEQVVARHGGTFVNDHIAFRTLATQAPQAGIASISRLFEALGYRAAGNYHFEDKQLSAIHYQHPNGLFPKLFISELRVWNLPAEAREIIGRATARHRAALEGEWLAQLAAMPDDAPRQAELLPRCLAWFHELPWPPPAQEDVVALNAISQYGAWTLVHGYHVNHFTSLVNSHGVPELDDLEKTIAALQQAGVPMKAEIEGERGSKLRQSATEAVRIDVDVLSAGQRARMPWSYAYFELAERNDVIDPATGQAARFEGFLGPQATNLFEMTRLK